MVVEGDTFTALPTNAPGFQVIGEILAVANKFSTVPSHIVVSILAEIDGIGVTVTFTVSLALPQALFTEAMKAVEVIGATSTGLPVNAPGFHEIGAILDVAVRFKD